MKAVRLKIRQTSANYRREETIDNKMTYPLPPFSTVIGAIHKACGYREYHAMDISVQGSYGALKKEVYQDHCFLNSLQNDRGILVKMQNPDLLSKAFIKVASARKSQGNDFRKGITIQVHDEESLEEYRRLKDKKDEIDYFKKQKINPVMEKIKHYKKVLSDRKKKFASSKERMDRIKARENEIKDIEKKIKTQLKEYEEEYYTKPYSQFRTLTCGPKYYEVLSDVELVIHVKADDQVLQDIIANQNNFSSLGRSEDFMQIEEIVITELKEVSESSECKNISHLPAYIPMELVDTGIIGRPRIKEKVSAGGTRYYLPKNYVLENGVRQFERKSVIYLSNFKVLQPQLAKEKIYIDKGTKKYLVCFS